jgi:hypothetical protein
MPPNDTGNDERQRLTGGGAGRGTFCVPKPGGREHALTSPISRSGWLISRCRSWLTVGAYTFSAVLVGLRRHT